MPTRLDDPGGEIARDHTLAVGSCGARSLRPTYNPFGAEGHPRLQGDAALDGRILGKIFSVDLPHDLRPPVDYRQNRVCFFRREHRDHAANAQFGEALHLVEAFAEAKQGDFD
jgi:hypothetical protein